MNLLTDSTSLHMARMAEQAEEASAVVASLASAFYKRLLDDGVPADTADGMAKMYLSYLLNNFQTTARKK